MCRSLFGERTHLERGQKSGWQVALGLGTIKVVPQNLYSYSVWQISEPHTAKNGVWGDGGKIKGFDVKERGTDGSERLLQKSASLSFEKKNILLTSGLSPGMSFPVKKKNTLQTKPKH